MSVYKTVLEPREPAIDLVRIISEGTYTSFAQSLKEFVSNCWDADAVNVRVTIDEDAERITIHDDGIGMTVKEFQETYASIARRGKSGSSSLDGRTVLGRRKVGRFGIGALAVAGVANKFIVRSTKRGKAEGFECSIDLENVRNQFNRGRDLSDYWKFAASIWGDEATSSHFTEVIIEGLRADIKNHLLRVGEIEPSAFYPSVSTLSGIDELRWRLGIICPVPYVRGFPIPETDIDKAKDKVVLQIAGQLKKANFHLFLNETPVLRPVFLPSYEMTKKLQDRQSNELYLKRGLGYELRPVSETVGNIQCNGYLVTQATQVYPEEMRGILIRIRGVAVGWHRSMHLSVKGGSASMPSTSGELWVDGLDEALQFDRESFRDDHPQFIAFVQNLERLLNAESNAYRLRSKQRTQKEKSAKAAKAGGGESTATPKKQPEKKAAAGGSIAATSAKQTQAEQPASNQFLPSEVFDKCPHYIKNTVHQINGCWNHDYLEACAVMVRRLLQLLIVDLYKSRGWDKELRDGTTQDLIGLKGMVNRAKGDSRFGFDSRMGKWLDELKNLGDIAAHDHTIRLRKTDLVARKESLRYASERLLFSTSQDLTK
jgi:hypothetical protein